MYNVHVCNVEKSYVFCFCFAHTQLMECSDVCAVDFLSLSAHQIKSLFVLQKSVAYEIHVCIRLAFYWS